jgi:hypothetical protein
MPRRPPKAGDPGDAPPVPTLMRDEILTCLTDPRQARYRAVAAARVASLDATGVPGGAAPRVRWRPRRRRLHIGGGLLTVGVACTAAVILLAAGVSLQGATAPAASASSVAAPGGPALADSARP